MSKGPNRRFPRTAQAMPEARPTIERDKIKHRRPNDLMFEGDAAGSSVEPRAAGTGEGELYDDDGHDETVDVDWSDQGEVVSEPSDWDEESEGDWVLDAGGDQAAGDAGEIVYEEEAGEADDGVYLDDEDEAGVVWEEDDFSEEEVLEGPDEVSFGQQSQGFGFAPEVELAGRRDVSPKAPKPPPPLRPKTQPRPNSKRQQSQAPGRQHEVDWSPPDDLDGSGPPAIEAGFARRQPDAGPTPARSPDQAPAAARRASTKRAALDVVDDGVIGAPLAGAGAGNQQALRQPRPDVAQRRRQKHPAPAAQDRSGRRHPARRGKGGVPRLAILALVLVLIAGGGWFAYRSIGPDGIQPVIDRVTALLPFPNSTRTAADTSFGDQETPETVSAEQALARLEDSARQENGGVAGTTSAPVAADEAAVRTDGPPVPQFKPLPGDPAPVPAEKPDVSTDQTRLAANDSDTGEGEAGAPSIFEQIWRYLSPG